MIRGDLKYPTQIALFLSQAKSALETRGLIFVEREASLVFLAERGMTVDDLREVIFALTVKDCIDGPEPDRDPRYAEHWTVAEFGPVYEGERLYLKISVRVDVGQCKCLSVKLWVEKEVS